MRFIYIGKQKKSWVGYLRSDGHHSSGRKYNTKGIVSFRLKFQIRSSEWLANRWACVCVLCCGCFAFGKGTSLQHRYKLEMLLYRSSSFWGGVPYESEE